MKRFAPRVENYRSWMQDVAAPQVDEKLNVKQFPGAYLVGHIFKVFVLDMNKMIIISILIEYSVP